ncbi:hypothetical protein HPB51_007641 [Rhipicephalus microplus]|uniref:Peptidase A2 domain-containing protein n=1 Tax=Rhipicephalus microplus TaxID=6941 RepID=A0A9J6ERZ9_RHIMP|nr:hypothetical protein HPB51_007641 [Rhipicephalus microplus]
MNGATRLLPVPAIGSPASTVPGKPVAVGAAQAGTYGSAHQVATTAGAKEPLMDIRSGSSTFKALLDTGSSISIFGLHATAAARASGAKPKANVRVLRLASGWSQSTMSLKCPIEWAAGCRRQQFLCVPDLCRDVVLGRDFLTPELLRFSRLPAIGHSVVCSRFPCFVTVTKRRPEIRKASGAAGARTPASKSNAQEPTPGRHYFTDAKKTYKGKQDATTVM